MQRVLLLLTLSAFSNLGLAAPQFDLAHCALSEAQADALVAEHVYGGPLDDSTLYERRAYVMAYNAEQLVPSWAAWHVTPAYIDTPKRDSHWKAFQSDPELPTVKDSDYDHWFSSDFNFARGHIAPYFISGGDRDNDGQDAEIESSYKTVEDKDDACTVYEINYMSNVAPQYHNRFNGSGGEWYKLETHVRKDLVKTGGSFNVFAGTVFMADKPVMKMGERDDAPETWQIGVPHGFFKVVIDPAKQEAVAFLFDHAGDLQQGCNIDDGKKLEPCIVSIESVEAATGLTFFSHLDEDTNKKLRDSSKPETWKHWLE